MMKTIPPIGLRTTNGGNRMATTDADKTLPATEPLTTTGDLAAQMVAGIDRYLSRELGDSCERRAPRWNRDLSSPKAYDASVEPNRERLRRILGVVDAREPVSMRVVRDVSTGVSGDDVLALGAGYRVYLVQWSVLRGVEGEGLLLEPDGEPAAHVVALPDADASPEMLVGLASGVPERSQFARRLAENACRVLIPTLIDRRDTYSGTPEVRMTNQPHREFLYRAAFEMGRHIVGYEVQKVLAAVDWFRACDASKPVGVVGYGEGGLVAFYSGAVDTRIGVVGVSGYFQPRESMWEEPIYRNVFGLLDEFGDAEIASLVAPRTIIIEASEHPSVSGPPPARNGRGGAAPGVLKTPALDAVRAEFQRLGALTRGLEPVPAQTLVESDAPGSDAFLNAILNGFHPKRHGNALVADKGAPAPRRSLLDADSRMKRQFAQILEHTQYLMREGEYRRAELWRDADATNVETWRASTESYREMLWEEVIGKLPPATVPANPRTRLVADEPAFRGYEVVLDVYPDVFAYGILLLPKDLREGERRPVVVCQHGLEGRPQDVADSKVQNDAYNRFACRLAERGFITFSPQNPYIGGDAFRVLQRKANPLKKSLFSVIVRQHERILEWLATLPYVDPSRMAFYGLSYGGKTAMRVPALLTNYCLSICSADYNEWIWKNTSARSGYSYLLTGEYEMFEFNLGNTFNYAEMSWLICPRPFMVERGHHDGVAPDEWVAYEFAKTWRRFSLLGIGDRAEMEVFNGPHAIHGVGTFRFLERHLNWHPTETKP
jgi:dienelactone hydrolase